MNSKSMILGYIVVFSITLLLTGCNLNQPASSADDNTIENIVTETAEVTPEVTLEPEPTVERVIQNDTGDAPEPDNSVETSNIQQPIVQPKQTCTVRSDWFTYQVVAGDTLSDIATRTQSTVTALLDANCLNNANLISVGQSLYVPNQPTMIYSQPSNSNSGNCTVTAIQNASIFPLFGGTSVESIGTLSQGQQVTIEVEAPNGYWGFMYNGNYAWLDPREVSQPSGNCNNLLTMFDLQDQNNNNNPQPTQFNVQPRTVARGGSFTVSWDLGRNVGSVSIYARGSDYRGQLILAHEQPSTGTATVSLPADNAQYFESAQIWAQGGGITSEWITIEVQCPFTPLIGAACPESSMSNASISYQAFTNGFMIAYQGQTFIAHNDGHIVHISDQAPQPADQLTPPAEVFLSVWNATDELGTPMYEIMGSATANAQVYTGTVQKMPNIRSSPNDAYVSLPDGRILTINYSFSRPISWRINN